MTVPAQPTQSSQSASSSSSVSGQPVTIATDTVTARTSVTGLAGVLAEADAADVAARIVEAVSSPVAARTRKEGQGPPQDEIEEIRVIGDLSALGDIAALQILTGQVAELAERITAYVQSVRDAAPPTPPRGKRPKVVQVLPFDREGETFVVSPGDVVNTLGTVISTVSQLVAGTYTYSGQAIPNASIGGFDILIARELTKKTSVPVLVDRFAAVPGGSDILAQIQDLASRAAGELNPALIQAAATAAGLAQIVSDDEDRLTEMDTTTTAPPKDPPHDRARPQEEYDQVDARLPGEAEKAATAANLLAEGQVLATAISAFVTSAVSAPTAGSAAPVTRAAHGEVLSKPGTAILYAQVIAAGDDQVLRQTLIHDTWSNLTGLTAEYALIVPGSEIAAFGLESAFAVTRGSIRKGLTDIARGTVKLRAD